MIHDVQIDYENITCVNDEFIDTTSNTVLIDIPLITPWDSYDISVELAAVWNAPGMYTVTSLEYIYDGGLGQAEVDEIAIIFNLQNSQVTNILKYASDCCYGLLIYNKEDGTWTSRKAVELMEEDEKTRQSHRDRQKRYMNNRDSQMTVDDSHVTVSNSQMTPKNKKEREKDIRRDLDKREKNKQKESGDSFGSLPPKKEAVEEYMHSIGRDFDVERFMDYYSSIGWKPHGSRNS